MKRIGTIIHGALGDCYEQLLSISLIRQKSKEPQHWVGFFAAEKRLNAMKHYKMDMLDEVYLAGQMKDTPVDEFYLFQAKDYELNHELFPTLPSEIVSRFDLRNVHKPWHFLREHNFKKSGLRLELSDLGKAYLPECMKYNRIDPVLFERKFTIGYLWRYRTEVAMAKSYFNRSKEWVIRTKNELFLRLIRNYKAHIIVAGMAKDSVFTDIPEEVKKAGVFVVGEHKAKVANETFSLPGEHVTYLRGLGYAAEMEIMSRCNVLLLMPSGFSEPLWMMRKNPVVLVDPVPIYMVKLAFNRMPLFNNNEFDYAIYNNLTPHSSENVMRFLKRKNFLSLGEKS